MAPKRKEFKIDTPVLNTFFSNPTAPETAAQPTASAEDNLESPLQMRTTVLLTAEQMEGIKIMSNIKGTSVSNILRAICQTYVAENKESIEQYKRLFR